ncbi:unnamed protein product, partial [Staurois parvus]
MGGSDGWHCWVALHGTALLEQVGGTAWHRWVALLRQVGGTAGHRWVALMGGT